MRHHARILTLIALAALPTSLFAQSVFFKSGAREEKVDINDPFAPAGTKINPEKAVWKDKEIVIDNGKGVVSGRRLSTIVRIAWPNEPAPMVKAREHVTRGEPTQALALIEPVLRHFEPVRTVPGNLWLKAAEIKLDALSGMSSDSVLASFIRVLEEADDGSVPGLASKIKLAKLDRQVRAGDYAAVIVEADRLMGTIEEPDMQARLTVTKGDALLASRKYEDAVNTYLRIPVFLGAERAFLPAAYLGTARALRGMDTPYTKEQNLGEAALFYVRKVIAESPMSKEATEARRMLPREEREALEAKILGEQPKAAEAAKPAETAAPAPEASSGNDGIPMPE